ncbi:hypothetical protein BU24DRAFT_237470 [Aaosphaeria arxii CBS 175.79]|uniref:Secreted protein n=1 Tax=Aaosphaeria arxii CBS 175.79 TaxID=1450172 RepID=A0A6A5XM67_9PLEO|nr:uncharacterized protein BU24DRAFT_237470 [Aaosphaeria arxii CBS 175.79]KAF2013424.1 hypothetical protein BU24DRAFT_237470 [Aaosphaeria arxii CBS 175.79]
MHHWPPSNIFTVLFAIRVALMARHLHSCSSIPSAYMLDYFIASLATNQRSSPINRSSSHLFIQVYSLIPC